MASTKTNIRNLKQLTNDMMKVYSELRDGEIDIEKAEALSSISRTIVGGCKVIIDTKVLEQKIGDVQLVTGDGNLEDRKPVAQLSEGRRKAS